MRGAICLLFLLAIQNIAVAENAMLTVFAENERHPAPEFTLRNLAGKTVSLSDYKGKLVLLNFWATWCLPCLQEMPSMETLYQKHQQHGLVVLAVCVDDVPAARVTRFLRNMTLSFAVLLDPQDQAGSAYMVSTLPVSYLIDQQGIISARVNGSLDWSTAAADSLLAPYLLQ